MNLLRAIAAHLHNLAATFASRGEVDALDARLRARIDGDVYCTDPVDVHADTAIALTRPSWDDEPSVLLREIYAAQALHRDGVDVFASAPKEAP